MDRHTRKGRQRDVQFFKVLFLFFLFFNEDFPVL